MGKAERFFFTANSGKLVTREELQQKLWPGVPCGDPQPGLNAAVNKRRETLGDSATTPTYIETCQVGVTGLLRKCHLTDIRREARVFSEQERVIPIAKHFLEKPKKGIPLGTAEGLEKM